MRRCPACGATNAATASWCSQCFAALDATQETAAAPAAPAQEQAAAPSAATGAPLRRTDAVLEWACAACETYNPMELSACRACATPFTARFATPDRPEAVDWRAARVRSALLPGLGHVAAGRTAQGVGRAIIFCVWLLGGVLVLAGAGARGLLIAAPLVLGAVVVHLVTLRDVIALERGRGELLTGRALLWLVVGVTVAVMVATVAGITAARPG